MDLVRGHGIHLDRVGGGEERVEAPHVEQPSCPAARCFSAWKSGIRRTISRPSTWSALGWAANAVKATSATSAEEIHCPEVSSKTASVYSIVVHASSPMSAIAALTRWSIRIVTDTCAPPANAAWTGLRP